MAPGRGGKAGAASKAGVRRTRQSDAQQQTQQRKEQKVQEDDQQQASIDENMDPTLVLNCRVGLLWPQDGIYYRGYVKQHLKFEGGVHIYQVAYDDGDMEEEGLTNQSIRWLGPRAQSCENNPYAPSMREGMLQAGAENVSKDEHRPEDDCPNGIVPVPNGGAPTGDAAVNWHIKVWWPGQPCWVPAEVLAHRNGRHHVVYSDGETEWMQLAKELVWWVANGNERAQRLPPVAYGLELGQAVPKGREAVHWVISVYDRGNAEWRRAFIEEYSGTIGKHRVVYNEGSPSEEWISVSARKILWHTPPGHRPRWAASDSVTPDDASEAPSVEGTSGAAVDSGVSSGSGRKAGGKSTAARKKGSNEEAQQAGASAANPGRAATQARQKGKQAAPPPAADAASALGDAAAAAAPPVADAAQPHARKAGKAGATRAACKQDAGMPRAASSSGAAPSGQTPSHVTRSMSHGPPTPTGSEDGAVVAAQPAEAGANARSARTSSLLRAPAKAAPGCKGRGRLGTKRKSDPQAAAPKRPRVSPHVPPPPRFDSVLPPSRSAVLSLSTSGEAPMDLDLPSSPRRAQMTSRLDTRFLDSFYSNLSLTSPASLQRNVHDFHNRVELLMEATVTREEFVERSIKYLEQSFRAGADGSLLVAPATVGTQLGMYSTLSSSCPATPSSAAVPSDTQGATAPSSAPPVITASTVPTTPLPVRPACAPGPAPTPARACARSASPVGPATAPVAVTVAATPRRSLPPMHLRQPDSAATPCPPLPPRAPFTPSPSPAPAQPPPTSRPSAPALVSVSKAVAPLNGSADKPVVAHQASLKAVQPQKSNGCAGHNGLRPRPSHSEVPVSFAATMSSTPITSRTAVVVPRSSASTPPTSRSPSLDVVAQRSASVSRPPSPGCNKAVPAPTPVAPPRPLSAAAAVAARTPPVASAVIRPGVPYHPPSSASTDSARPVTSASFEALQLQLLAQPPPPLLLPTTSTSADKVAVSKPAVLSSAPAAPTAAVAPVTPPTSALVAAAPAAPAAAPAAAVCGAPPTAAAPQPHGITVCNGRTGSNDPSRAGGEQQLQPSRIETALTPRACSPNLGSVVDNGDRLSMSGVHLSKAGSADAITPAITATTTRSLDGLTPAEAHKTVRMRLLQLQQQNRSMSGSSDALRDMACLIPFQPSTGVDAQLNAAKRSSLNADDRVARAPAKSHAALLAERAALRASVLNGTRSGSLSESLQALPLHTAAALTPEGIPTATVTAASPSTTGDDAVTGAGTGADTCSAPPKDVVAAFLLSATSGKVNGTNAAAKELAQMHSSNAPVKVGGGSGAPASN